MKLVIENIVISNVQDTGSMWDPQDPCVSITLGPHTMKTARQTDAGVNAEFTESFTLDITEADLDGEIEVQVYNESILGNKKHVGVGKKRLRDVISKKNVDTVVLIELVHVKGKKSTPKGTLKFRARISEESQTTPVPPAVAAATPPGNRRAVKPKNPSTTTADTPVDETKSTVTGSKAPHSQPVDSQAPPSSPTPNEGSSSEDKKRIVKKNLPRGTTEPNSDPLEGKAPRLEQDEEDVKSAVTDMKEVSRAPPSSNISNDEGAVGGKIGKAVEKPPEVDVTVAAPVYAAAPVNLKLLIQQIAIDDVEDTGTLLDGQDPMVTITVGDQVRATARVKDAGVSCIFPESFTMDISEADLDKEIIVEVDNAAKNGNKKHVGRANSRLREVISTMNKVTSATFPLLHTKGKKSTKKGVLTLTLKMQSDSSVDEAQGSRPIRKKTNSPSKPDNDRENTPVQPNVDSDEISLGMPAADVRKITYLKIRKIHVRGLPNVETFTGENDPWVELAFGDKWSCKTNVIEEGGGDCTWEFRDNDLNMMFDVTLPELRAIKMKAVATDHNHMFANTLIGTGEGYIKTILDSPLGADVLVTFNLKNDKLKKAPGKVDVIFQMHEREVPVSRISKRGKSEFETDEKTNVEPFSEGTLRIHRIKCVELKDVENFGKNDPFVILTLAAWNDQTEAIEDVGDNALWDNLDFSIPVTSDFVNFETIRATVMDRNTLADHKLIGAGSSQLTRLLTSLDAVPSSEVDLVINLVDSKKKYAGKVILYATLDRYVEKATMDIEVSDKLSKGTLAITRIRANNLLNVETVGKNDPYVVVSFAEHPQMQTAPQVNAGSTANWTNLDLKVVNVTRQELIEHDLCVEVWEKNDISKDKLIGTGKVSAKAAGAALGSVVDCRIDLVDARGGNVGRVVLDVVVSEGVVATDDVADVSNLTVSEGFTVGKAYIKRICVFDAANTEIIGRQDLYVTLACDTWFAQTDTLDNIGPAGTWDNLDYMFDVDAESLPTKTLKVSVWDENNTRGDELIGEKEGISLLRAAADVGTDVTLSIILPNDKKGKPTGRVTILLCIKENDPSDDDVVVDETFSDGCLHISKIVLHGVKKSKHNYAKVIFGEFTKETESKPGPVYDYLNIKPPLNLESLMKEVITLQACTKGLMGIGGESVIGQGSARVVRAGVVIGETVELEIPLANTNGEVFGKAVIHATAKEEKPEAAEVATPPSRTFTLPEEFTQGVLFITQIKAFGLKNKEIIGKSDPYVTLEFDSIKGLQSVSTKPYVNAGGDVIWDDVDIQLRMSADDILANKLVDVSVWDVNTFRKNVCIGAATASLRRFASKLSNEIEISVDILDPKTKAVVGRVQLLGELREAVPEEEKTLPEGFSGGILRVVRIVTFSLANLEVIGKQDPYVKVKAGDIFEQRTFTQDDAGGDVTWNYLDMAIPVTPDFLQNERLVFEAWEDNTSGDLMIGVGDASLREVVHIGEEVELNIPIVDKKKRSSGRLSAFVRLEPPPPKEIEVSPDFTNGMFFVTRIVAFGLSDTEWFGKSDPFVALSIGSWDAKTNVLDNKGNNVMWDFLDFRCPVTADQLKREKVSVSVFNKNTMLTDTLVGTGEVRIAKAGVILDKDVELSVILTNAKGEASGRLVLYCKAKEGIEPEDSTLSVDEKFRFGTLSFDRIRSFDLKNTEIYGKQDPYVVLKIGEWTQKTYTQEEGGGDVLWDFIDIRCDVTDVMLMTVPLEIVVYDENKHTKDALIGNASCKLVKPGAFVGQEVELHVSLTDDDGKPSGRLVIYVTLSEEVPEQFVEVPDTFERGELKIVRVCGFDLKNTEIRGKQDPYVELIQEDFEFREKTTVQQDIGANPVWNFLDYSAIVRHTHVKVGRIMIKVWDKNVSGDTLIGTGDVAIRKTAGQMGKNVELRTVICDEDEEEAGRVVIVANLRPLPPEAADKDIKLPKSFTSGIIHINRVTASGLPNKELFGKQDPYVKLDIGVWSGRTETRANAGGNVSWPHVRNLKAEVDRGILLDQKLRVSVCDENTMRSHKTLGTGKVSLRSLATRINSEVELRVDLSENGAACGFVVIGATLREARAEEVVDTLAASSVKLSEGILTVKCVVAKDIIGGDSAGLTGDKQDLYVVLSIDKWKWEAPFHNNCGSSTRWDDLEGVSTAVNGDVLKLRRLCVSVYDKNTRVDKLIGSGDVGLRMPGSSPGKDVLLPVPITTKNRESCGLVEVLVQVSDVALVRAGGDGEKPEGLAAADEGFFEIRKLELVGLRNKEWFGKQDPYCELKLGAYWKYKTSAKENAGTNASWDTEISQEVVASQLQQYPFEIVVKDENSSRKDSYLGRGTVSGMSLLLTPNKWTTLTGDLNPSGKFRIEGQYVSADHTEGRQSKREEVRKRVGRDGRDMEEKAKAKERENAMQKQLRDELDRERKQLAAMMADMKKMQTQVPQAWHGMSVTELKKVVLPSNVLDWRAAHVQAWLAFKMDLPQHVQQFQNASIDGFLLLKHVDDRVLRDRLQIGDDLDVEKILGGIERLKAHQVAHDRAAAKKEAEEEVAAAEAIEKSQKKKMKKRSKPDPITFFGDVKEQNDLERVRLERLMRQQRAEQAKTKKKLATRSDVWKFEYTGGTKPISADEELCGRTQTRHGNTPAYERLMTGLFHDNVINTDTSVPTYTGTIRQIPHDSVVDEVVAVTKAAMFELSNRLLALEQQRAETEKGADSDIDEFGEDVEETSAYVNQTSSPVHGPDDDGSDGDDDDDDGPPPPKYEESVVKEDLASIPRIHFTTNPNDTIQKLDQKIALRSKQEDRFDRSLLVFNALVNRQNNDASFLGRNEKLTRMKFQGGLEAVLKLKMSWPQFDALWTKLDFKRSGELDAEEFGEFFGDFSEYDYEAAKRQSGSLITLADIMYELCNAVRREGFTMVEIFSSFDRNGSGEVSVSEFCSMVRAVLGQHVDKKNMFRAFALMDVDSNRCISCQEVLTLVYNVWKTQMKELAGKLSTLDPELDSTLIHKIMDERNKIKDAVKRNFPREWRDRLERSKDQYSRGPFAHLLKGINVSTGTITGDGYGDPTTALDARRDEGYSLRPSAPAHSLRSPVRPHGIKRMSGKNEILRYKVNKSRTHVPTREGAILTTPHTTSLGKGNITSEGAALRKLQRTEPAGGKVFAMTTNL